MRVLALTLLAVCLLAVTAIVPEAPATQSPEQPSGIYTRVLNDTAYQNFERYNYNNITHTLTHIGLCGEDCAPSGEVANTTGDCNNYDAVLHNGWYEGTAYTGNRCLAVNVPASPPYQIDWRVSLNNARIWQTGQPVLQYQYAAETHWRWEAGNHVQVLSSGTSPRETSVPAVDGVVSFDTQRKQTGGSRADYAYWYCAYSELIQIDINNFGAETIIAYSPTVCVYEPY
jgi:hypothetical protein